MENKPMSPLIRYQIDVHTFSCSKLLLAAIYVVHVFFTMVTQLYMLWHASQFCNMQHVKLWAPVL